MEEEKEEEEERYTMGKRAGPFPRGAGGMPDSSNFPRRLLSLD